MSLADIPRIVREGSAPLYWVTLAHLAVLPFLLVAMLIDNRIVLGINPWIKPVKFFLSTSIFMITTAWLLRDLGHARPAAIVGWMVATSMAIENVLITLQSARGITSHFNTRDPLNSMIFSTMGIFIVVNTVALIYLFIIYFAPARPLSPAYLWGIRFGLFIFIAGSLEAVFMLQGQRHTVGGADGGPGLPFLNWSTRMGDLRIAHFLGLHALQILPLAGWLIDRSNAAHPVATIVLVAAAYALSFVLVLLQALSGKPLVF